MNPINTVHFILYVRDQEESMTFYKNVLKLQPRLHVKGMTEFELKDGTILGLMPESSIIKILGANTKDPASGNGVPRCELYLYVDDVDHHFNLAINHGAIPIRSCHLMDWGDHAAYVSDRDGHILAFANRS